MKQYNIVFFDKTKNQFVAPQYLPEVPSVHYSQVKSLLEKPRFVLKADGFLPKSVINSVIAKHAVSDDRATFFKYGVKTGADKNDLLLIEADYPNKKIYVFAGRNEPVFLRNAFAEILQKFDTNIDTWKHLSDSVVKDIFQQERVPDPPVPEPAKGKELFISIDDNIFVDWTKLWNDYRTGKQDEEYIDAQNSKRVLRRMFELFYLPFAEVQNLKVETLQKPQKLFISYSSKNTNFMRRFVTHLEPLKRNGSIEPWYDRMIEPGTKWDDSIKNEMNKADIVVFLLSPDFIATNYIFEFEIPQAIKQMESKRSRLFLIELQSCSWDKTILSTIQMTVDPNAENKEVILIKDPLNDEQWKNVIGKLEEKIKKK